MSEKLSADLNIIQSAPIELELLDGDLNIIQKLDDEPNDVGGLTSAELKAKFDESGNIIKKYINETLIPAVLAEDATEESRKQAEAARVAAEQVRQSNEAARQNAEAQRVSAENARNVWEDYSSSKAYAVGNKVASAGSSYLCIKPCTGIAPPNAEYWRLIAAKGAQGPQGPQGAIGPEGPVGGSSNFVRYDAAQTLTDAQKTQARVNIAAAPDGFGYGGALDTVSGATDEEFLAAVEAKLAAMPYMGAMQINWGSYPALDGFARVGTLAKHSGGQYASITGYSYGGTAITRCKNAGTWGPWEWVNPPLALGVEYRTTERYLGNYCTRLVGADGIEYWSSPSMPYWHSAGKAIAYAITAGGNITVPLEKNRTYFLACCDNVRKGLVAVQTATNSVLSITPIITLDSWSVTLGTGLTVIVTETDSRYAMRVAMTCLY